MKEGEVEREGEGGEVERLKKFESGKEKERERESEQTAQNNTADKQETHSQQTPSSW